MAVAYEPLRSVPVAVLAAIHAETFAEREAWKAEAFADLLRSPGVDGVFATACGFCLYRVAGDEGEIITIAVRPELRQRGDGAGLLSLALQQMRSRGVGDVFLEVSIENVAALRLYEKFGFEIVGERRAYYPGGIDAWVMRQTLSRAADCGG